MQDEMRDGRDGGREKADALKTAAEGISGEPEEGRVPEETAAPESFDARNLSAAPELSAEPDTELPPPVKGERAYKNGWHKFLREWVLPFAVEIVVVLFILKFLFFFVVVPTGSMIPTIDEHSLLFATRVHNPENLQYGDVVVFDSDELGITLVKRLVGLPGDTVELIDGQLYRNGEFCSEDYVYYYKAGETLSFTVPEGCYLFFGDNRRGSLDARYWDDPYIDGDKIQGKVIFTIWPFENFGLIH